MWKLLYIEDDEICAYTTVGGLELLGCYEVIHAKDGKEGWEKYQTFHPDIIVSDVEMPKMTGFEFTQKVRAEDSDTLIILATGRQLPKDVIYGFELGIDNYIKKPFVAQELHAHIQALITRQQSSRSKQENLKKGFQLGKYVLDTQQQILVYQNEKIKLTRKEYRILELLLENRGELVSREEILVTIWGANTPYNSRSLDVFISKLRKYFSHDNSLHIINVRGKGLIFGK